MLPDLSAVGLEDKVTSTEEHTLFVDRNSDGTDTYKFYLGDIFSEGVKTHDILNALDKAGVKDNLKILINSNGGSVNEGIRFINNIISIFGDRVTVYMDRTGKSMGALIFSSFEHRVIYQNSDIMYHNYSSVVFGSGGVLKDSVEYLESLANRLNQEILVDNGFLTPAELKQMLDGKEFWFDSLEMCKRGIATHVIDGREEIPASTYIEYRKAKSELSLTEFYEKQGIKE